MTYENPRKSRLLKEALGDERAPLPSAGETCLTIAAMVGAIIILVLAGRNLPDSVAAASTLGQRHASVTIPSAVEVAPAADDLESPRTATVTSEPTSETGNVVDLTY